MRKTCVILSEAIGFVVRRAKNLNEKILRTLHFVQGTQNDRDFEFCIYESEKRRYYGLGNEESNIENN